MTVAGRGPWWPCADRHRSGGRAAWLAVIGGFVALVAGCEPEPLRIPRIPPDLTNWNRAYRAPKGLRLHVFTTGTLEPPRGLLGGSWFDRIMLRVPVFLIEHPRAGLLLVGTGLSGGLVETPAQHLGGLLTAIADPNVAKGQDVATQLRAAGFAPERVRRVILGDLRFPQTGEVARFPEAEVVVAEAERTWALGAGALDGVRRADVAAVRRWSAVDLGNAPALGTLPHARDLLGDGSVVLLDAAGYTPGTVAVLVRLATGPVVLAGGAAPLGTTMRYPIVPAVATDRVRWWESIWRLKRLRELVPDLVVVPGFEIEELAALERRDIRVHRRASPPPAAAKAAPAAPARPPLPLPEPPAMPPLPPAR